jgi:hypothetical protein
MSTEPQKIQSLDAEFLSGERFPYQEDISLVEEIDLEAATPGQDINWLEDIELLIGRARPPSSTATRTPSSRSTSTSPRGARTRSPARC